MRRSKKQGRRPGRRAGLRNLAAKRAGRYKEGVQQGYEYGLKAGLASYDELFDGTSIILPICNERTAVLECMEAIAEMTDLPYEMIVVDNGSQDGIAHDLKRLEGQVRYRLLNENAGFGGAVNRGLMMAKGTTILIMSCRMRPTEQWLEHLLACLKQDESIGLVGPVSGGLAGEQQVLLDYADPEQMHEAARMHNEAESGRMDIVSALSEHCLLMRKETLSRVGYFDEGLPDAGMQMADYCLRVKLQGYSLACAKDAYMEGKTMDAANGADAVGSEGSAVAAIQLDPAVLSNLSVETAAQPVIGKGKWDDPNEAFLASTAALSSHPPSRAKGTYGECRFYPEKVAVQGLGGTIYWIEEGIRRPIEGEWRKPVVRLSQLDLWRWPIGRPIQSDAAIRGGSVQHASDGSLYYIENGSRRPIINAYALAAWCLQEGEPDLTEQELAQMRIGDPIIAPVQLRQSL